MGGRRLVGAALASTALALVLVSCGDSEATGPLSVRFRLAALHSGDVLARGGLPVRLRVRPGGRVLVKAVVRTRGGRRLRLGSVRLGLRRARWRRLKVPIGGAGRATLAGCPAGRVLVTVSRGKRRHSATAPLLLDPPDCGRFFGDHTFWNEPLSDSAALDPDSDVISAALRRRVTAAFSSGAPPTINTTQYTPPVYTVGADAPTVPVQLDKPAGVAPALRRAFAAVPLPPQATPASGVDSELVVWQPASDTLWEFWQLHKAADGWHASWGGKLEHVSSGPGVYTGTHESWGATATSLPLVGGLITPRELREGTIDHALAMAVPDPRAGVFSRPAQRTDGPSHCASSVPEGARFRLDPGLDIDSLHLPGPVRALARAAQRYGMYVRDRSSTVVFYAENAASLGSDPYPALFGGQAPWDLLKTFPWDRVQLVRMDPVKAKNAPSPLPGAGELLSGCG